MDMDTVLDFIMVDKSDILQFDSIKSIVCNRR